MAYSIYVFAGDAAKSYYRARVIVKGADGINRVVADSPSFKTAAEARAWASEWIASQPPVPPPIPGPTPQPGPEPSPWDDKTDGGGWDVLPVPVYDYGGGTYAGFDTFGVSGSAWEYPSMWFEATTAWGDDKGWNYSNAWTGFSVTSWDYGGAWGESGSGGGWFAGLVDWFRDLF